jgi:hypothetical protein
MGLLPFLSLVSCHVQPPERTAQAEKAEETIGLPKNLIKRLMHIMVRFLVSTAVFDARQKSQAKSARKLLTYKN